MYKVVFVSINNYDNDLGDSIYVWMECGGGVCGVGVLMRGRKKINGI